MKPIWYFVGILLVIMGSIVEAAGLYTLAVPPVEQKVLAYLHPDIWWGAVMLIAGAIFLLANRKKTIQ